MFGNSVFPCYGPTILEYDFYVNIFFENLYTNL